MTAKFVVGLPPEGQLRKHTAVDDHGRGRYLVIGNDDGTVDVLKQLQEDEPRETPSQVYRHLFRFRAFTKPIISIELTGNEPAGGSADCAELWIAITALHDNYVHCYVLEGELLQCDVAPPGDNPNLNGNLIEEPESGIDSLEDTTITANGSREELVKSVKA